MPESAKDPPVLPDHDFLGRDRSLLDRVDPALATWWKQEFGSDPASGDRYFTPPQREAIPKILAGENVLLSAPTGSGKTLASFTAVIDDLLTRDRNDSFPDGVHCLYISPLKALANDIQRNLEAPLNGVDRIREDWNEQPTKIRHAIRHGDTDDSSRQSMLEEPPHILNTTPETLAILLNAPKFRDHLRSVKYVIVDEIHSLAGNKRGSHLAVSLERLEALAAESPVRIGCSATVDPLDRIGDFLVGFDSTGSVRPCEIVDCRDTRDIDIELRTPVEDLIQTPPNRIRERLYDELHDLIQSHTTTIVFTNTRSGAERVLHHLQERFDSYEEHTAACHHGSLSEPERRRVESALKEGSLEVVTTSTSLELGIDMPTVDLVIQIGSPKSVSALLQRFGRAGHRLHQSVTGRIFVLDRDDLRECAVLVDRASSGFIDSIDVPEKPLDVAVQHVYGMAIVAIREEQTVRSIIEAAFPYRTVTDAEWEQLMRYMTASYAGLEDRNVYAKIWRDTNDPPEGEHHYPEFPVGTRLIGKRGRLARMIYMTNVGTIPDSFSCDVVTREDSTWVGSLDEQYLDTLSPGEVFLLGGSRYVYRYRQGGRLVVDPTSDRPTVPSWYSERLPLATDLGPEIREWHTGIVEAYSTGGASAIRPILERMPIDTRSRRALEDLFTDQFEYVGEDGILTTDRIVIEEVLDRSDYERRYYVHTGAGRSFNDGCSRLLAKQCAEATDANVRVAVSDLGFALTMPLNRKVDLRGLFHEITPETVPEKLRSAIQDTDLMKRHFRMNATRALMVLTRYKGYEKSARHQQVASEMLLEYVTQFEDFLVLEETYRELLEDHLAVEAVRQFFADLHSDSMELTVMRVGSPSPLSFGLATLSNSDIVLASDESAVLNDFHRRVQAAITDKESGD